MLSCLNVRGGVEDTRLEAKDTKKFRGQCPFGQGQGPRKQTQVFSKKKGLQKFFSGEKSLQNFFSGYLYLRKPKKGSSHIFRKVSSVFQGNFSGSKIVLSSIRGQGKFRGLEALRPRTSKCVLEAKDVLKDSTPAKCTYCTVVCENAKRN